MIVVRAYYPGRVGALTGSFYPHISGGAPFQAALDAQSHLLRPLKLPSPVNNRYAIRFGSYATCKARGGVEHEGHAVFSSKLAYLSQGVGFRYPPGIAFPG